VLVLEETARIKSHITLLRRETSCTRRVFAVRERTKRT